MTLGVPGQRRLPGGARRQPARRRRAVLRRLRDLRRQARVGRRAGAAVLRHADHACSASRSTAPGPGRPRPVRRAADPAHRHLQAADPGRVGRAVRGHRRLRRRRDPDQRGARPPAPQGPADLRRARGAGAAAAGAAVLAHRAPRCRCRRRRPPAPTPARRSPRGASPTSTGSSSEASRSRPEAQNEALPLPRHPRPGRRRRRRVRRGAALRRPRRARRTPGPARARRARAARPRRLVGDRGRRRAVERQRPRGREGRRSSGAARPGCASSRCRWSRRTSRSSAPATASARSAPWPAASSTGTWSEPIGAVTITLTDGGRGRPAARRAAAVFDAFLGHKEAVSTLPRGAVLLASSRDLPGAGVPDRRARLRHPVPPRARRRRASSCASRPTGTSATSSPDEGDELIRLARAAVVTEPPRILARFVELFAR